MIYYICPVCSALTPDLDPHTQWHIDRGDIPAPVPDPPLEG